MGSTLRGRILSSLMRSAIYQTWINIDIDIDLDLVSSMRFFDDSELIIVILDSLDLRIDGLDLTLERGHALLDIFKEGVHICLLLLHHLVEDTLDSLLQLILDVDGGLLQELPNNLLSLHLYRFYQS